MNTPKANPENLLWLIKEVYQGKVILPEFQRSFVWTKENIEELLVSILQEYFIGTFLILDTPPEKSVFPLRLVEGLEEINPNASPYKHPTVRVVLDGQQRLTSLFYVIYEPPVPLNKSRHPYKFFLILNNLIDGNPDDAVSGVSLADRRRLSEMQKSVDEGKAVPISLFRDAAQFYEWLNANKGVVRDDLRNMIKTYYERFSNFMIPIVSITSETGKDNIINIFERINKTGVRLSLFDLIAARLYLKGVNLRELWDKFTKKNNAIAKVIQPEFIIKIISIWQNKEPRKSALLDVVDELDKKSFENKWEEACYWLKEAYNRVSSSSGGYGAFKPNWIPYTTLLVPLAVLLWKISQGKAGEATYRKLDSWYWASVFTQRYDQAVDSTSYKDFKDLIKWIDNGECPSWIENFQAEQINLDEADDKKSAIYRGIMCLIVQTGARDFINGQAAPLLECQDDHIFPKSIFGREKSVNSILNRTLISASSNQIKGKSRPSEYISKFLRMHGNEVDRFLKTLNSHLIPEEAIRAMERDDFSNFIELRKAAIKKEIIRRVKGQL